MTDAWHQARLIALTKTKHFPKSPDDMFKADLSPEKVAEALVAGGKARLAAQNMDARLKRLGKERVIRRKE